jgi:hypoxanthine phosphoribosyltransferase
MIELPPSSVVFDEAEITGAIDRIAGDINVRCAGREWILMCVMNGGLMFTAEIMKRLTISTRLDSLRVSRYHETTSGNDLRWHARPNLDVAGKSVLLLDDIFDEGETLAALIRYFGEAGASEIVSAVLVEKLHERKVKDFRPDLIGLTCPDVYVFGFGMDYEGRFRHLPEIRELAAGS